jgi:alcohol dehydrogenase
MYFNLPAAIEKFALIAEAMGERIEGMSLREAAFLAVEAVETLIDDCGIEDGLQGLGVSEDEFPTLARQAMTVARPLANNPRPVSQDDAIAIYREAM